LAADVPEEWLAESLRAILSGVSSETPTRPDEAADQWVETATPDWRRFMASVKKAAEEAWATGRRYYEVSFLVMDGSPKFAKPDDVAGAIEAIASVGWRLAHTGYVNVSGAGQATGVLDSAHLKVRGFYLFARPPADA
jgi:hypothetical protein